LVFQHLCNIWFRFIIVLEGFSVFDWSNNFIIIVYRVKSIYFSIKLGLLVMMFKMILFGFYQTSLLPVIVHITKTNTTVQRSMVIFVTWVGLRNIISFSSSLQEWHELESILHVFFTNVQYLCAVKKCSRNFTNVNK